MKRLIEAANKFVDGYDRKNLATWWSALFAVVWDSGTRTGELLQMRWEWLNWNTGNIRVPASVRKGKRKVAIYRLKEKTLEKLRLLGVQSEGIIFQCGTENNFFYRYGKLLERAGIPRNRKNGLQKWRRSFATYIELYGGDATRELLHDDRGTTKRSYLDAAMLNIPQNHLLFPVGSVE